MQERHNSIANTLELRLSCTKSLIWCGLPAGTQLGKMIDWISQLCCYIELLYKQTIYFSSEWKQYPSLLFVNEMKLLEKLPKPYDFAIDINISGQVGVYQSEVPSNWQYSQSKAHQIHVHSSIQFTIHNIFIVYQHTSYMIHNVSTQITFYWHIHIYTSMTSLYYGSKGSWKSYWIYGPLVWYT